MNTYAIILAGGKSSRMGRDKKNLIYKELSFLEIALNNLRSIKDAQIYLSGYEYDKIPFILDIFQDIGPISGIYSTMCFLQDKIKLGDIMVFVPVDMPKLNPIILQKLISEATKRSGNFFTFREFVFPLVIKYQPYILELFKESIKNKKYSLKKIMEQENRFKVNFNFSLDLLTNINYKDEYLQLLGIEKC